jgi:phosphoribosyl 1,2-cyclic phosphodiesterase
VIRLYSLGSGSRGNAFALESEGRSLLLDAGFSHREIVRRAAEVGLDLGGLVAVAVTHEHGDHARGVRRFARHVGVPIIATEGTHRSLAVPPDRRVVLNGTTRIEVGPFTVAGSRVLHDAAEPTAMLVECDGVRVGLAYDFGRATVGLRYLLREADALIVESNYDEVMLRTSDYPASVQHRIAGSGGHLSNHAAALLLGELLHPGLSAVVLAHLSQQCNAPDVARVTVERYLRPRGFRGTLAVALQDRPLPPITVLPNPAAAQVELDFS